MNVFEIEADLERNVLRTYFRGVISGDDMRVHVEQCEALISKMRPEFTVVVDLAELETMELDCVPYLTNLMDRYLAAGVGKVVRVIPDPNKDIGFNLLSLTHYRGRVPILTCETRAEADRALGLP